jgi:hypothetical protein
MTMTMTAVLSMLLLMIYLIVKMAYQAIAGTADHDFFYLA